METAAAEKVKIEKVSDLYNYIQSVGASSAFQNYCSDIVNREVYLNQSMLIEKLFEDMTFQYDDIINLETFIDGADNEYDTEEEYEEAKQRCEKELEDLQSELDEAQEDVSVGYVDGDYLTEDYKNFYQYGKLVLTVQYSTDEQDDDEMWQQIRAHMDESNFFPDVYFQDERGWREIMLQEPSAEREFEQAQTSANQRVSDLEDAIERKETELSDVFGGYEYENKDIYEWWAVSSYLLAKLKEWHEAFISNDFGDWWGRTTTGQAIRMDSVIENIACEEMLHSHYKLNEVLTDEQIAALDLPQKWERK